MGCPKTVEIGDNLTFTIITFALTGQPCDADSDPTYRIYETETATPILTGTMSIFDDDNTDGFYAETIACTVANGFERDKIYTIHIYWTVGNGAARADTYSFTVKDTVTEGLEARFGKRVIRTSQIPGIHIYDPINAPDTIEDDAALLNAALQALKPSGVLYVDSVHALLSAAIVPRGVSVIAPDSYQRLHRFGDLKGGTNGHAIRNEYPQKGLPKPDEITSYSDSVYPGFTTSLPVRLKYAIDDDDTTCTLETNQGRLLEPAPGWITIDSEVCAYSDITGDVVTIERGDLATSHPAGTTVQQSIVDHDIKLSIGVDCHGDTFTNRYKFKFSNPPEIYFNAGVKMLGVHNLDLTGLHIYNQPCWALWIGNLSGRVVIPDTFIKTQDNGATGDDGIHINGPCGDILIERTYSESSDNAIAINFGEVVCQHFLSQPNCGGGDVGRVIVRDTHILGSTYPPISICGGEMCRLKSLVFENLHASSAKLTGEAYCIYFQSIADDTTVIDYMEIDGLVATADFPSIYTEYPREGEPVESWLIDAGESQIRTLVVRNIVPALACNNGTLLRLKSNGHIGTLIRQNVLWNGQGEQIDNEGTIDVDIELPTLTEEAIGGAVLETPANKLATDASGNAAADVKKIKTVDADTAITTRVDTSTTATKVGTIESKLPAGGALMHAAGAAVAKSPATLDWSADVTNPPTIGTSTLTTDDIPTPGDIAEELLDHADAIESDVTVRKALQYIAAVLAGKVSGARSGVETFTGVGGSTPRVQISCDESGNRTAVEYLSD